MRATDLQWPASTTRMGIDVAMTAGAPRNPARIKHEVTDPRAGTFGGGGKRPMEPGDLEKLHAAVEWLLRQESFSRAVECLGVELDGAHEPFVWTTVALDTIPLALPASIQSCWIFLLKRDVPSGSHYHPNSVQHMVALNGRGRSSVGGVERAMVPFGTPRHSLEEKWHVIDAGIPHEFFPEGEDMTVVSFHTCAVAELVEIASGSGARRLYEPLKNGPRSAAAGEPIAAADGGTGNRA